MFTIECIIFLLILLYSLLNQLRVLIMYKRNKKIELKDASGLFVSKEILNKNDLGTLYVTKIKGKYNDHYDIERNVIRLSEEVYDKSNLSSLVISFYQTIKALKIAKTKKRKEEKIKNTIVDYANKISFFLFVIAASSKAFDVMSLSLFVLIAVIVIKYYDISEKTKLAEQNLIYLKKEYKLKKDTIKIIEMHLNAELMNELSLHILNNKY